MPLMDWLRRRSTVPVAVVLLTLLWGCSRPLGFHGDDGAAQANQAQAPFRKAEITRTAATSTAAGDAGQNSGNGLPFTDSQSLPVGTLLTVRLKTPVWTDAPEASGTFEAVVDEAITVDGNTVLARGASVSGRVESARASKSKDNRNYVRLTLDAIDVDGREFPVQTSSLFARGRSSITATERKGSLAIIHLEKGRRLTFRLTEPVYVATGRPVSTP